MLGAIAGDIIGSPYEFVAFKHTEFPLFSSHSRFTDDSVLTIALADALLSERPYLEVMREYVARYPRAGYGTHFAFWARSGSTQPYGSYGNGSAMRVSPAAYRHRTLEGVLEEAKRSADVTHNHPEGIRGAQATAAAIFLGLEGESKATMRAEIVRRFGYDLGSSVEDIRPEYVFDETCPGTVPAALIAFLDSSSYEDAVRKAVSLGGDADTLACITGSVAEAYYGGVPGDIEEETLNRLDDGLRDTVRAFRAKYVWSRLPRKS